MKVRVWAVAVSIPLVCMCSFYTFATRQVNGSPRPWLRLSAVFHLFFTSAIANRLYTRFRETRVPDGHCHCCAAVVEPCPIDAEFSTRHATTGFQDHRLCPG